LDDFNLVGSIPHEIVYLSNLEVLDVGALNLLSGQRASTNVFLTMCTNVNVLNYAVTIFKGDLPGGMAIMKSLNEVIIEGNYPSFAGNINKAICEGHKNNKLEILAMDNFPVQVHDEVATKHFPI
jgi:hypothetical protein